VPLLALCALSFCNALAQNTSNTNNPGSDKGAKTFKAGINLVLVPVVVRNRHGKAVGNLTQDNFEVFDKGKRQKIVTFSALKRANNPEEPEPSSTPGNDSLDKGQDQKKAVARPQETTTSPRAIAYLLDDLDINFPEMVTLRKALSDRFREMASADQTAIYTFSGRPQIDFTNDRETLEKAAAKLRPSTISLSSNDAKQCPDINYYLADLIQNRSDPNAKGAAVSHTAACAQVDKIAAEGIVSGAIQQQLLLAPQQNRMALRTLRLVIRRLAQMPGERVIVLSSPGFFMRNPDAIHEAEEILRMAIKARITISAVNSRGLYTAQPQASDHGETSRLWWGYFRDSVQADEGILQDLAQGTGGDFVHNLDIGKGLARLAEPPEFSYVLGFDSVNAKQDGSFHSIKVHLVDTRGLNAEARRGYYAFQENPKEEAARLEVDDALFARDQKNGIPVVLLTGYAKPAKGDPTVNVVAKVSLKPLQFRSTNGRNSDSLTVVSALFDNDGRYVTGTTKTVNLQLRDETLARTDPSITLRFHFPVKRGAYVVRVVIRDEQSGAMTTFTRPEAIP
jgi:VWFA-related protein